MKDFGLTMRFDEKTYRKAEEILNANGYTMAEAARMFVDAVVAAEGLPFTLQVTHSKKGREVKVV